MKSYTLSLSLSTSQQGLEKLKINCIKITHFYKHSTKIITNAFYKGTMDGIFLCNDNFYSCGKCSKISNTKLPAKKA